jgi:hypothetical protein
MIGNALVGFCVDKTGLLWWERPLYSIFTRKFLACQMPDCQDASFFERFVQRAVLTMLVLAYQMP